jgi:hydrogenase expression/formation protein HypC
MCLGIPGQIVALDSLHERLATVDVSGVKRKVDISCIVDDTHLRESCIGEWVLVHVGFAMSRIDEAQVAQMLKILTELGEAQSELAAILAMERIA